MKRRNVLQALASVPLWPGAAIRASVSGVVKRSRVRPSDSEWPSSATWSTLRDEVGGRLTRIESPWGACLSETGEPGCRTLLESAKNPFLLGDNVAMTQSLGWVGAWVTSPSAYAVEARTTQDVVAAVNFARKHRLRIVIKGGGHSYQGTSSSVDSLLVWTRAMKSITVHDDFIGLGCPKSTAASAVSIEAGVLWGDAYNKVTTEAGRYVQGGGCMTVGVAGLVQSGGFGSFSKAHGLASSNLLQAEVVVADGTVKIVNRESNPDLFWALKGGGGGSFGVVTRLTLRTHDVPTWVGAVNATFKAETGESYLALVRLMLETYRDRLANDRWGEKIVFLPGRTVRVEMLFQGLTREEALAVWQPVFERARGIGGVSQTADPVVVAAPGRRFWDPQFLKSVPGLVARDDRPNAADSNVFWTGDAAQSGQVIYAYQSLWLPDTLLANGSIHALADALVVASSRWPTALHFNKGLSESSPEVVAQARDTAINPSAIDAFALVIISAEGPPSLGFVSGRGFDADRARSQAEKAHAAMAPLRSLVASPASYLAEADYFEERWQEAFWGSNYPRLSRVKQEYDPHGLFFVHHGVGSEGWSGDGFTPST